MKIPKKNQLKREFFLLFLVKLALLYALWLTCFSQPLDKQLNAPRMTNYLITHCGDKR